jgi:hypothetical protein
MGKKVLLLTFLAMFYLNKLFSNISPDDDNIIMNEGLPLDFPEAIQRPIQAFLIFIYSSFIYFEK